MSLALAGGLVGLAPATRSFALTAKEAGCRATVAKQVETHLRKALKTIGKCHVRRGKGTFALATDCNDLAQADPTARLEGSRHAVHDKIVAVCAAAPALLAQYPRCPSPANTVDDAGSPGIDDFGELADCMVGLVDAYAEQAGKRAMGAPATTLPKTALKCQKQLGKGLAKLLATIGKVRVRCQTDRDAAGQSLAYGCNDFDADGKIAKTLAKLRSAISTRCQLDDDPELSAKQEVDRIGACGDTVIQLGDCIGNAVGMRLGAGLVAMAYGLPDACTAGGIHRTVHAGAGEQLTDTFLSLGWTGTTHGIDWMDRLPDHVLLGGCDPDCASCQVGLDPRKGFPDSRCRCNLDPTKACDTVNGLDIDDCGVLDTCNCYLGPPLAISGGGVPACTQNRYLADHSGTVDVGAGQWRTTDTVVAIVHAGENSQLEPCPICEGDVTENDGMRDGTCSGGMRAGLPCDTNAVHPTFGPSSHDCRPNSVTNVSGSGIRLNLDFATSGETLTASLPCNNPPGALCPCRSCSGDSLLGCTSDAECAAADAGTCTSSGIGSTRPNQCADGVCTDGSCLAGPREKFCDGVVRGNGRGFIQCNFDADCALLDVGNCSITQVRPCFDDPIVVDADGDQFGASQSTLFCLASTNSAAVNAAGGLPGPGVVTFEGDYETACASDPSIVWEPPAGVNCP